MDTTTAQKKLLKRREPNTGWDKTVRFSVTAVDILNKLGLIYVVRAACAKHNREYLYLLLPIYSELDRIHRQFLRFFIYLRVKTID